MIKLGDYNTLSVVKAVDFGLYLDGGESGEILLPSRYVPAGTKPGDELEVFIYLDQDERLVLRDNIDNEAKIDIVLFEKQEGDTRPNTTSFYFRPVRIDGEWYLTTKDNITDTRSDLRKKHDNEAAAAAAEAANVTEEGEEEE